MSTIEVPEQAMLFVSFGSSLPEISADGLTFEVLFVESDAVPEPGGQARDRPVLAFHLQTGTSNELELRLDISAWAGRRGRFTIRCVPGHEIDPRADWLAIHEFVVCAPAHLAIMRARAYQRRQLADGGAHFTKVYEHPAYEAKCEQEDRTHVAETGRSEVQHYRAGASHRTVRSVSASSMIVVVEGREGVRSSRVTPPRSMARVISRGPFMTFVMLRESPGVAPTGPRA